MFFFFEKLMALATDRADELAQVGAGRAGGEFAEVVWLNAAEVSKMILAAIKYAATFNCEVGFLVDMEEVTEQMQGRHMLVYIQYQNGGRLQAQNGEASQRQEPLPMSRSNERSISDKVLGLRPSARTKKSRNTRTASSTERHVQEWALSAAYCQCWSDQDVLGQCTHAAPWSRVFRTIIDVEQPYPGTPDTERHKLRQERKQHPGGPTDHHAKEAADGRSSGRRLQARRNLPTQQM